MRKAASIGLLLFACALTTAADIPRQQSFANQLKPILPDGHTYERSLIRDHWVRLAAEIALLLGDDEAAQGVLKLKDMPLAVPDEFGIHILPNQKTCDTSFMVVLQDDLQYFPPNARAVLERDLVVYLPYTKMIVVTEDVQEGDYVNGKFVLLAAMASNLPPEVIGNPAMYQEWKQTTIFRMLMPGQ